MPEPCGLPALAASPSALSTFFPWHCCSWDGFAGQIHREPVGVLLVAAAPGAALHRAFPNGKAQPVCAPFPGEL